MPYLNSTPLAAGLLFCRLLTACSAPQFDPGQAPVSLSVDQLLEANHFRRALARLTAAPSQTPQYLLLLSRAQLGLGQFEPAMQSAEKALAMDPKDAALHVQAAAVAGRTAEHASMFKQLSLAKRARKELEEALLLEPKNPDALYGLILYSDIAPAFLGGDKAKALTLSEQLTALAPARGYLVQATLAHNRKDARAEESFLRKATAADPNSYDAHVALAVFSAKSEPAHPDEAGEQACQALYADPTRVEAWQLLAELAADSQCLPEIDGLLYVANRFNPDDLSPAYHAAVALIATGKNFDFAETLLTRYLEVPPEGNSPSAALARYRFALILEKRGQNDRAVELLRAALNEDPSLEEARKDLKRLEHLNRTP